MSFLVPGLAAMTVLFASMFAAISIVWEREFGFLKELLVAPVPRGAIVAAKMLAGSATALIEVALMLLLSPLIGARFSPLGALASLPLLAMFGMAVNALGIIVAARMKSFEGFGSVVNFVIQPVFFLSGALYPIVGLPRGAARGRLHQSDVLRWSTPCAGSASDITVSRSSSTSRSCWPSALVVRRRWPTALVPQDGGLTRHLERGARANLGSMAPAPEAKVTAATLRARKGTGERIAVLTAYDVVFARLADEAGIDVVLVGDSLGMVVQGERSTLPVTLDEMVYHTRIVVARRARARTWSPTCRS